MPPTKQGSNSFPWSPHSTFHGLIENTLRFAISCSVELVFVSLLIFTQYILSFCTNHTYIEWQWWISCDSCIGTALRPWRPMYRVLFPAGVKTNFSHRVQTSSEVYPASCPISTETPFLQIRWPVSGVLLSLPQTSSWRIRLYNDVTFPTSLSPELLWLPKHYCYCPYP